MEKLEILAILRLKITKSLYLWICINFVFKFLARNRAQQVDKTYLIEISDKFLFCIKLTPLARLLPNIMQAFNSEYAQKISLILCKMKWDNKPIKITLLRFPKKFPVKRNGQLWPIFSPKLHQFTYQDQL